MTRDYGTGSITQRGPQRWQLRWYEGVDPVTGHRRRRTKTVTGTKTAAQRELAKLAATREDSSAITLGDLIERWLALGKHAKGTLRNYRTSLGKVPAPLLGMPIDQVRVDTLDITYATLARDGVSKHRIVNMAAMISGALQQACTWQWLTVNVARFATVPQPVENERSAPELDSLRALWVLVKDDPQLAAWLWLDLTAGTRRQEIHAIRWRDIDLAGGGIRVQRAIDPIDGALKDTKSKASRRTIGIGPRTVNLLKTWKDTATARALEHGKILSPDAYVFSDAPDSMKPWRLDLATKRFAKLRRRAGVPDGVRLYDLRHAMATYLLASGRDAKTVAGRMGHSRVATTTDTYGHVIPARDQDAGEYLDALLDEEPLR